MGPRDPSRSIVLVVGVVVVLVAAATAVVLLFGAQGPREYPADSPEGTIQRYLRALEDRDPATAYTFFSAGVRERMSEDDFVSTWSAYGSGYARSPGGLRRVQVDRVELRGDVALVSLTIEEFTDGGLSPSRWSWEKQVRLAREAGEWRIDEALVGLDSRDMWPAPVP